MRAKQHSPVGADKNIPNCFLDLLDRLDEAEKAEENGLIVASS